ncbi:MAG: hypothetical protein ACN6NX_02850, partial [Acinetobacter sp.]
SIREKMKTLIKSVAILATLLGSGLVQADTTTASIPMGVDIPKSCTISNLSSSVVVPEDGTDTTGGFTMICNIPDFTVRITTDSLESGNLQLKNPNGVGLPMNIRVNYSVGGTISNNVTNLGSSTRDWYTRHGTVGTPVGAILNFNLSNPTTATTPAGVYTDTFRVNVNY